MLTDHRAELKTIRTFPSLVRYLRDEMGWPIDAGDFQELTFEYTPEELGIDAKNAAKIQEIKRLRPLSAGQPWGIFFVKFEPKRLPVVALRRILSRVALKKRASANNDERAAWAADDLLFVSNFGEGDERQISFAHFSQHEQKNDLPTLKVLGWDNLDTLLHLDHVAELLTERLTWPDNDKDVARWRDSWRSAFTLRHREVITTSKALAVRLAELARAIRDRIRTALAIETEKGPVTKLMKAFQEALIHDLDGDGFADMYAQTIAYGLLSARVTNPKANTADGFAAQLPVTNPFLKELMETFLHVGGRRGKAGGPGIDFDELGVSEVVELLDGANMEAVVRDFGDRNPQEDPVVHFYELFLKEYDAKKRMQRGVFYTLRPVVSYIVRSVDELLRSEFGLADGLADTATWAEMVKRHAGLTIPEGVPSDQAFVQILDPATGTGTFLVEAIEVIRRTLVEKWKREGHGEKKILDLWNDYVSRHLLPRLHGYELLMASYAIAHLKIGLKLHETGYRFESDERARIYLTNALEPASDSKKQMAFREWIPALAHEAQAVNEIKRRQRFTVVIGNPPYSGHSANASKDEQGKRNFIGALVHDYYFVDGVPLGEQNPKWLQDDYVKFLRLGQHLIHQTGAGTLAFITNHGYVDNPTFRGMRRSLMQSFGAQYVLDLHGNTKKKERAPDGSKDENVFDIQQGVAIGFFIDRPAAITANDRSVSSGMRHTNVFGVRDRKYEWLLSNSVAGTKWAHLSPEPPRYLFKQQDTTLSPEYDRGWFVQNIFPSNAVGFQTHRDYFVLDLSRDDLLKRMSDFADSSQSDAAMRARYFADMPASIYPRGDTRDWKLAESRKTLRTLGNLGRWITKCVRRPFDFQYYFFHPSAIDYGRPEVMGNLIDHDNVALLWTRPMSPNYEFSVFVANVAVDQSAVGNKSAGAGGTYVAALYQYPGEKSKLFDDDQPSGRRPNLATAFVNAITTRLRIVFVPDGRGDLKESLGPEDIVHFIYALFHSPSYRTRYADFLKIDFPRLPLPGELGLFRALASLGGELVALHLVEAPAQAALSARYDKAAKAWRCDVAKGHRLPVTLSFNGPEKPVVGKVGWSDDTVWIDAVKPKKGAADARVTGAVGFRGVSEEVWNFHIGGYQVCEKWLKDRKDRTLTADDIAHYHRIVIALHETIRLMREIDETIDAHGGWPGAFANKTQERADAKSGALS